VSQSLDPKAFYKRDMLVAMDGVSGEGVLVVPQGKRHDFSVIARAPMGLYTFNSCHREVALQNMPKTVAGYFVPKEGIEDQPGCMVEFGGYDSGSGQHSWALVDFEDTKTTLPHTMKCNGDVIASKGVTICQSRAGLIQQIEFPVKVVVAAEAGCQKLESADRQTFQFPISRGRCVYRFEEIDGKRQARLTSVGYESILLRKD
jgi:hypothetical protein